MKTYLISIARIMKLEDPRKNFPFSAMFSFIYSVTKLTPEVSVVTWLCLPHLPITSSPLMLTQTFLISP